MFRNFIYICISWVTSFRENTYVTSLVRKSKHGKPKFCKTNGFCQEFGEDASKDNILWIISLFSEK